ncbi:hypothetical protein bcere0018_7430 [Bacillus cereus Rock1-15]|nr:hypothetical protein bcere0018_7430 [Bacillus cereus Rock1-15]
MFVKTISYSFFILYALSYGIFPYFKLIYRIMHPYHFL